MSFKKIVGKIHLWLGLGSGLVVLIVGLTGCILAFREEIEHITHPWLFSPAHAGDPLPPSVIWDKVQEKGQDKGQLRLLNMQYPGPGRSVIVSYAGLQSGNRKTFVDPHSGALLATGRPAVDFFDFIEHGHRWLWFPWQIGRPIQGTCILIFLVMMITGMILWWPKRWSKAGRQKSFTVKWKAGRKRINYDLHNVLGFYMNWVVIFIVITGLSWSFQWMARTVYFTASGGRSMAAFKIPSSDTTLGKSPFNMTKADSIWWRQPAGLRSAQGLFFIFPATKAAPLLLLTNDRPGTTFRRSFHYYDQYTLKDITRPNIVTGDYDRAALADKIIRMRYDLHTGGLLNLPGKILAFLGSLVAASLPVTGFLIWRGKRKKKPILKK